jgi:riboflavin synthase
LEHTNLGERKPGDEVNIETDIVGKYIEKLLVSRGQGSMAELLERYGYTKKE